DFGERIGEDRPMIGAVGEQLFEIREPPKQRGQQQNAAVAVLNSGGMNDGLHQQPLCVDERMTLLALDLLSRIEPVRIDRGPCTLHVFAAGLIGRLAGRASLPGATFCPCAVSTWGDARPGGLAAMQVQWGVAPGAPVQGLIGIAAARAKSGESIMSNDVRFFGGIDWTSETHEVCRVAADGKIIGERAFAHGGAGLAEMCDWLVTTSGEEPPTVAVAIEAPHGPVVEILLERRFQVDAVNP